MSRGGSHIGAGEAQLVRWGWGEREAVLPWSWGTGFSREALKRGLNREGLALPAGIWLRCWWGLAGGGHPATGRGKE